MPMAVLTYFSAQKLVVRFLIDFCARKINLLLKVKIRDV